MHATQFLFAHFCCVRVVCTLNVCPTAFSSDSVDKFTVHFINKCNLFFFHKSTCQVFSEQYESICHKESLACLWGAQAVTMGIGYGSLDYRVVSELCYVSWVSSSIMHWVCRFCHSIIKVSLELKNKHPQNLPLIQQGGIQVVKSIRENRDLKKKSPLTAFPHTEHLLINICSEGGKASTQGQTTILALLCVTARSWLWAVCFVCIL